MKVNTLIVDDNEHDRYLLKRWLSRCSFDTEVSEVGDGQEAMDYFARNASTSEDGYPPAIIFLDINMPRLNGFEFLERFASVRAGRDLSSIVIVMFTSSPRQDDKDMAFKWDFVCDFIVKGEFETEQLEKIVFENVESKAA